MNARTDNATQVGMHVFERAGLGLPPYKFTGVEEKTYQACPDAPVQACGMCDYCGTCIRFAFGLRSRDGRQFVVGCDCIERSGDAGLIKAYKNSPEFRALQRQKRAAKDDANKVQIDALLTANADTLRAIPRTTWDGGTEPLLDFLTRVIPMCGASGRANYLRFIKKTLAA